MTKPNTVAWIARTVARPIDRVAQVLRGEGIDDMRLNGERRLIRSLLPLLSDVPILLDAGANVGAWSLWVASIAPGSRIHAFEPDPRAYASLAEAATSVPEITCHELALGSERGQATLYSAGGVTPLSSLHRRHLDAFGLSTSPAAAVSVTTVDAFCAQTGIHIIDFLKIDVEGHEYDVLSGARDLLAKGRIRAVQFEYGGTYLDAGRRLGDVVGLFPDDGYALFKLVPWGVLPLAPADVREERFMLSNYAAVSRDVLVEKRS